MQRHLGGGDLRADSAAAASAQALVSPGGLGDGMAISAWAVAIRRSRQAAAWAAKRGVMPRCYGQTGAVASAAAMPLDQAPPTVPA